MNGNLIRVAIGTRNGQRVTEHFGHAQAFQIWEIDRRSRQLVEVRRNVPACGSGCDNSDKMMDASVALVADCRAVVVSRIGECALNRLSTLGILAFETDDSVDDTISQLSGYAALTETQPA